MLIGIRTTRTGGCRFKRKGEHPGVKRPTLGQVTGYEPADEIDLSLGQLAFLAGKHKHCDFSLECIADALARRTSYGEELEAADVVDELTQAERE